MANVKPLWIACMTIFAFILSQFYSCYHWLAKVNILKTFNWNVTCIVGFGIYRYVQCTHLWHTYWTCSSTSKPFEYTSSLCCPHFFFLVCLFKFVSWVTFKPLVFHLLGSIGNCKMDNSTLAILLFSSHGQNGNGIENLELIKFQVVFNYFYKTCVRSMPCFSLINRMMLLTRSKMPTQNFVTDVDNDIGGRGSVFNSLLPADCLVTAF